MHAFDPPIPIPIPDMGVAELVLAEAAVVILGDMLMVIETVGMDMSMLFYRVAQSNLKFFVELDDLWFALASTEVSRILG